MGRVELLCEAENMTRSEETVGALTHRHERRTVRVRGGGTYGIVNGLRVRGGLSADSVWPELVIVRATAPRAKKQNTQAILHASRYFGFVPQAAMSFICSNSNDPMLLGKPPASTAFARGSTSPAPTQEVAARCWKHSMSIFSRNLRCWFGRECVVGFAFPRQCELPVWLVQTTVTGLAQSLHSSQQDLAACQCQKVDLITSPQVPCGIYEQPHLVIETVPLADFLVSIPFIKIIAKACSVWCVLVHLFLFFVLPVVPRTIGAARFTRDDHGLFAGGRADVGAFFTSGQLLYVFSTASCTLSMGTCPVQLIVVNLPEGPLVVVVAHNLTSRITHSYLDYLKALYTCCPKTLMQFWA